MQRPVRWFVVTLCIAAALIGSACSSEWEHTQADPLTTAVLQGDTAAVKGYLKENHYDLDAVTFTGKTLLAAAVEAKRFSVIPLLLDAGADPQVQSYSLVGSVLGKDLLTPLAIAASYGYEEAVVAFLEHPSSDQYSKEDLKVALGRVELGDTSPERERMAAMLEQAIAD